MNVKSKNIEITVGQCKKMPDIAVLLGIYYDCSKINLIKLKTNNPGELYTGAEGSALGYALFEVIRDKFIGSPLELSRSRVSRVDCDSINGKLLITWNTQGSLSMMRKTIGLAVSTLDPIKLYSKYAENIKLLGGKQDRTVFNYYAAAMVDALKKGIKIAVSGKINIDEARLKDVITRVEGKMPTMSGIPKEVSKSEKHTEYVCDFPSVKASGIAAVVTADYIKSKSGGMGVDVYTNEIIIYNKSWPSKHTILKDNSKIKDYTRQKYEKLGSDFACILAYMAITQGYAECCTISQIIKNKPKASDMADLII
jgi:hypothetical protein